LAPHCDVFYEVILKRDKLRLDLFWIKDQSLTDTESLPPPDIIATENADELAMALQMFSKISARLTKAREQQYRA
jgi:type I restriction enzyme M protein